MEGRKYQDTKPGGQKGFSVRFSEPMARMIMMVRCGAKETHLGKP
jgi:hypothetical protein